MRPERVSTILCGVALLLFAGLANAADIEVAIGRLAPSTRKRLSGSSRC